MNIDFKTKRQGENHSFLLPAIHGQSSLISQFLHPTCFEITGIITKPIKLNEIVSSKISAEYFVISR